MKDICDRKGCYPVYGARKYDVTFGEVFTMWKSRYNAKDAHVLGHRKFCRAKRYVSLPLPLQVLEAIMHGYWNTTVVAWRDSCNSFVLFRVLRVGW